MSLADILRRIDGDAETEASAVVRAAEEDAVRLRRESEARAKREAEELLARTEAASHDDARTRIAAARLKGRDSVLGEKRILIERVLAQAVERLESLPDAEYAALMAREIAAAARGGERLFLGTKDAARLREHLPEALDGAGTDVQVEDALAGFERGVLLESGKTRVQISAASIVEARSEDLEALVTRELLTKDAEG